MDRNQVKQTAARLLDAARQVLALSYSPYSGFKVGAAVMTLDGRIFSGANIENAAYGETLCAEKVAIAKAVSEGAREFVMLAVVAEDGRGITPCGGCRQVLIEFSPDCLVVNGSVSNITTLRELLPQAFLLKDQ